MPKSLITRKLRSKVENQFEDSTMQIFRAIVDPIILLRGFSSQEIPEYLLAEIQLQRLIQVRAARCGQKITEATNIEALAYLMTVSLANPLDRDWGDIYSYLVRNFLKSRGYTIPTFPENNLLKEHLQRKLGELKRWIKEQQNQVFRQWVGARIHKPISCTQGTRGHYRQRKLDEFRPNKS